MAPNILLVGNCQVRPIESLLKHLNNVEETHKIIVHLAKDSERETHNDLFKSADIIISQQIQDRYPCQAVRSSILKANHPDKIIFIPNLFYKGYTPDLRYLRLQGQGTLDGPLGDYHSSILLKCWKEGRTIEDTVQTYRSSKTWKERYHSAANDSLVEYKRRESTLDIKMANFIENNIANRQLFFTFNHPSKLLITELVKNIAKQLALKPTGQTSTDCAEPLDRFQVPIHPYTQKQLELTFEGPKRFLGVGISKDSGNERKTYRLKRLVTSFFRHYERNRQTMLERGVWS